MTRFVGYQEGPELILRENPGSVRRILELADEHVRNENEKILGMIWSIAGNQLDVEHPI